MSELQLAGATPAHALELAPDMAPADVAELAALGLAPLAAIERALRLSEVACSALAEGRVVAMFGVVPMRLGSTLLGSTPAGEVWFLTGRALAGHPLAAARTARRVVRLLVEHYGRLGTLIDGRHHQALRFAALCGARFGSPSLAASGVPFVPFEFAR